MTRKIIALSLAAISTYIAAVILVSQLNISQVIGLGFSVSLSERFAAVFRDLVGMLSLYLPLVSIALLIAFGFTSLLLMRFINKPATLFPLAGFAALIAIHLILNTVFGVAGIAPTRTIFGLLSQGVAGVLGGYIYYRTAYAGHSLN